MKTASLIGSSHLRLPATVNMATRPTVPAQPIRHVGLIVHPGSAEISTDGPTTTDQIDSDALHRT